MRRKITGDDARQAEEETNNARYNLMTELDRMTDGARQIDCTRVVLAIDELIAARIKWSS